MRAVLLLTLLAVAAAVPVMKEKRIILSTITDLIHKLTSIINSAKSAFNSLVSAAGQAINFDHVVQLLIPMINSKTTQAGCNHICVAGAAHLHLNVLPASVINSACGHLCKAALAELEKLASG